MQDDRIDAAGRDDEAHDSAHIAAQTFLMHLTGDAAERIWIVDDLIRVTDAKQSTAEDALAMLIRDGLAVRSGPLVLATRAAVRGEALAL